MSSEPAAAMPQVVAPMEGSPSVWLRSSPEPVTLVDRGLAWGLALLTVALMFGTQQPVGYTRDEGYYFEAAGDYEGWFVELQKDISAGHWSRPFEDDVVRRYWTYNHEHPVLAKTLFALSHLLFHKTLGWLNDATAYRLPAFCFAGLVSWALFWLARPAGRFAGAIAPLLFWAVPRHFFHAHLAAFDMPVVATWCLFILLYVRSIDTGRGAWKAGVAFGLALATKHNALFLPLAILPHWLLTNRLALVTNGWKGFVARIPRAWPAMAILGPLILYLHWPYLWHHPINGVNEWLSFHLQHINYPWQYFGKIQKDPPFPVEYPLALEALTVPAATVVLMAFGAALLAARALAAFFAGLRGVVGEATTLEWLLLLCVGVAIGPFMTRYVPIFGGIKHWMAGPALLCVPAAELIVLFGRAVWPTRSAIATLVLATLVLVPGVQATAHFHPFGTSAYNEIAGGAAGGAALGMQRQYWSNNVTAVLPWLNEHTPRGGKVYFHEVNGESYQSYRENGQLRKDIGYARDPRDAANSGGYAVYQYHQEFRDREFEIWNEFGTTVPELSFAIDEAPQIVVYGFR